MLFNNNFFIFILLPIIVSIYYFIPILFKYKGIYNKLWLILCSLFIYASFGYKGVAYLLLILAFNYCIGRLIIKNKRISNILFLSGLIFNISIWLLIKNYLFIENSYNFIFNTYYKFQHWYVPVGWGMIILQQIYYLIECKRKIILSYNVIDYLTFSLFFPKLIAGPLVSYNNFIANFSKKTFYFNYKNISAALFIFFYGLFLKVFFADTFFVIVEKGFLSNSLNFVQAWVISLCNIFSIFFDISGYTNMAKGIALLFNIKIPDNFNYPFKSLNVKDFWDRWHTTFTLFFKNNIAQPILNKINNFYGNVIAFLSLFIVMSLWHKFTFTFVLWGLINAIGVIISYAFTKIKINLPKFIAWTITFIFLNFSWVFFSADTLSQAIVVIKGMLSIKSIFIYYNEFFILWPIGANFIIVLLLILSLFMVLKLKNTESLIANFITSYKYLIIIILFIITTLLFNTEKPFLYYAF